ncbi:hypothetical protein CFOL_v3_34420 [Cephalotus follicularis]|uniref:Uncharacterized protein n=1 Tax=Cephalotus follicularis TaxID=3775 RepID=A0A1Q3DEU8_CEPFO|nr:hypothetical protein CFOL_v3_34420 [Cephalotus follicularis]
MSLTKHASLSSLSQSKKRTSLSLSLFPLSKQKTHQPLSLFSLSLPRPPIPATASQSVTSSLPHEHFLQKNPTPIGFSLSHPTSLISLYSDFVTGDCYNKVGAFCWLSLAICIVELLICIKFGHGL